MQSVNVFISGGVGSVHPSGLHGPRSKEGQISAVPLREFAQLMVLVECKVREENLHKWISLI